MSTIFPPGLQLGERYRIVRWIATGSACALFEAEDFLSRRRAALKWLRFDGAKPDAIALALRRAQAAADLRHAHLVDVYDVVREGSSLFITSELLRGEPLQAVLAPHLLPLRERLRLLVQAMRGVAAAHERGLVHGGLHPRNIFLACQAANAPMAAKVLDVGTSRRHGASAGARTSGPVGTGHAYVAPEQLCQAEDLDPRADVYALAAIAYQALTQHLPYEADNLIDMAAKLARGAAPPASSLRPEIPSSLDQALSAALARDRAARPAGLAPLIDELQAFSAHVSLQPAVPSGASTELMVRWRPADGSGRASGAQREKAVASPQLATSPASSSRARRLWLAVALGACVSAAGVAASAISIWSAAVASGPPPLPLVPARPFALNAKEQSEDARRDLDPPHSTEVAEDAASSPARPAREPALVRRHSDSDGFRPAPAPGPAPEYRRNGSGSGSGQTVIFTVPRR